MEVVFGMLGMMIVGFMIEGMMIVFFIRQSTIPPKDGQAQIENPEGLKDLSHRLISLRLR